MRGGVTEAELASKATAPRVTLDQVENSIVSEDYFTAAEGVDGADLGRLRARDAYKAVTFTPLKYDNPIDGTPMADLAVLTFCVLRLWNGYTVHGVSACADPANFNREIGERLARADAVNKIWPLLGFELKTRLTNQTLLSQGAGQAGCADVEPQASASSSTEGAGLATGGMAQTINDRLQTERGELHG